MHRPQQSAVHMLVATGCFLLLTLWAGFLLARSGGIINLSTESDGCRCHEPVPNANGDVTVDITGPTAVEPGATSSYTISVSGGPASTEGGFNLSATGGTLIAGINNQVDSGQLTHIDEFSRSWTFDWQAPLTEGTESFFAVGQATDGGGNTNNDSWNWYGGAAGAPFDIVVMSTVGVKLGPGLGVSLATPQPNPFLGSTRIEFTIPKAGAANLAVFDVRGRQVVTLASGNQSAGKQVVTWDGRNAQGATVSSGMYLIRLDAAGTVVTKRVAKVSE